MQFRVIQYHVKLGAKKNLKKKKKNSTKHTTVPHNIVKGFVFHQIKKTKFMESRNTKQKFMCHLI